MPGVRLSELRVTGFRGISSPVAFDLSAPLTVVFAPNGTGKTTMCEAAEWLLTGQVERLKKGKDFDAAVLRSKFAQENESPSVDADLLVAGKPLFLARSVDGSQSPAFFGDDRASVVAHGPSELLALLAPSAAASEAHHLTAINLRQRWLKGTRFLTAEALGVLVDTDDETIERRTQVFADLLGIRHLLDAERQCEKFASDLASKLRSLMALIGQQSTQADELERALSQTDLSGGASKFSARSEAAAAGVLLGLNDPSQSENENALDDRLASLTVVQSRQRHALDERIRATQQVEVQFGARTTLEQALTESTALTNQLSQSLAAIEEKGRAAAALVAERTSQRELATEAARTLVSTRDRLAHLSAMLMATLRDSGPLTAGSPSLRSLAESVAESRWAGAAREQRRRDLAGLHSALEQATSEGERLRLIDGDLKVHSAALVSEESLAALRRNVADAEARARAARSLLDATADPVARLQSAARDLVAHDHGNDVSKCPACAHDWGGAERLRAAIARTLAAAPQVAEAARAGVVVASEAVLAAQAKLDAAISTQTQIAALEKDRAGLVAAAEQRNREMERLDLGRGATFDAIARARGRLDVADALAHLLIARDALMPTSPDHTPPLISLDVPISGLLDELNTNFAARDQTIQSHLAALVKSFEDATRERDELRTAHATTQQQVRECRNSLRDRAAELASLRDAWQAAAGTRDWSDLALSEIKTELAASLERLTRAESHIGAARAAWASESRRTRLDELRRSLRPLLERQKRMTGRIDAANRARAVLHTAYTTSSRQQVQDLSRVVNPLFARMHANRVIDRIDLGERSDFLHWLANAGDQQLDPGKDFSQGQRQDLALALFLARARSLGGTFFLDEPVIHLDDLNRVGLLDVLRATVLDASQSLNLVITTASRALTRHLIEKFAGIDHVQTPIGAVHPLKVIELDGNGRSGLQINISYPLH